MNEIEATKLAEILGGRTWQSGGGIWLVVFRRSDGRVAVLSAEAVTEYQSEEELQSGGDPTKSILLC